MRRGRRASTGPSCVRCLDDIAISCRLHDRELEKALVELVYSVCSMHTEQQALI